MLKTKIAKQFCFNKLCWDGFSRKRCPFTMYAQNMEQCAHAVARNPACGTQFSYIWDTSFCDCAPVGTYCTPQADPKGNVLEFSKLQSYPQGVSPSTTAFATNANSDVFVLESSKSASLLQTTTGESTTVSSHPMTSLSRKPTTSSHTATLSRATRARKRPTAPSQKTTHSRRFQQTQSPPRHTTQAIKDVNTQFAGFSISSRRSTVHTPNRANAVPTSPFPESQMMIPFDCMDWFDGCQNCVVEDGEIIMCTNRFCYDLTSGFCREFNDGRLCQDADCLQPSFPDTPVYLRTTMRSHQNMTLRGNTTIGNFSQPESDVVSNFAINAPFLVMMMIMGATTVILFAVLMTVGSFLLSKNKRKRQQQVNASGNGALRQNAPITKHLKQVLRIRVTRFRRSPIFMIHSYVLLCPSIQWPSSGPRTGSLFMCLTGSASSATCLATMP